MQFTTTALVSLLAVTGSLAAPTKRTSHMDTTLEVRLQAETFFLHVPLDNYKPDLKFIGERFQTVNFKTIEVLNGASATPRCKILDQSKKEIIAKRNDNIDTTFSDAGKGAWTFLDGPTGISEIQCDPAFTANNLNVQNFQGGAATAPDATLPTPAVVEFNAASGASSSTTSSSATATATTF